MDDLHTQVCVSDKVKNVHVKVFKLMPWLNETSILVQHELCECKCGLNESVCNTKQKSNNDECPCECKELDD